MRSSADCNSEKEVLNIIEIINSSKLKVVFQPIISVSRKMVSGFEGLIRGINSEANQTISPIDLFKAAHDQGLALEFDRVCREKILEAFSEICPQNSDKLLFINIDASILDEAAGSNYLLNQVKDHKINPNNVVIEINETQVQDNTILKIFTDTYRKLGFMIALDDVGTGFSNMDRILNVRPDIIKTDISLARNIHNDYYKQGVFKSLVNLSNQVGALVVAEGVETEEEAIHVLRLGGHMIQGYFFAKPLDTFEEFNMFFHNRIEILCKNYNRYMRIRIKKERYKNRLLNHIIDLYVKELADVSYEEFDNKLMQIIWTNKNIECAYILDENGIQASNTIQFCDKNEVKESLIFHSAKIGTDHSMEKYCYPLINTRLKKYMTEPYISLATGNLCITISKAFKNRTNQKYILCMDFNALNDQAHTFDLMKENGQSDFVLNINGKSVKEINQLVGIMNDEIYKDSLTNAFNRRYLEERLLVDIFNTSEGNQTISVILADIDHFKDINDTYGHLAGDYVLKEFVKLIKRTIRKGSDWIARYGGEEFLIALPAANKSAAFTVAEKLREAIEKTVIQYKDENIHITASFGAYTLDSKIMTYEQLIDHVDKNLYLAKNSGRNKTVCG